MLTVGDFCLKYKELPTNSLPLYRIDGQDGQFSRISNRTGVQSSVISRELLEFDSGYAGVLWDEIVATELQIKFIYLCLDDNTNFGFLVGRGVVKIVSREDSTISDSLTPWVTQKHNLGQIEPLNEARLMQLDGKLEKLEETHEFLLEALSSL